MADDCRMADWNTGAQPHCSIHGFERNENCHECRSDLLDELAQGGRVIAITSPKDLRYFDACGLKWGTPVNVEHLILQLQTLDPEMKVGAVAFIEIEGVRKARTYGLSRSRERWDENGWLNYKLPGPECLAFWAAPWEPIGGVNGPDTQVLEWKRPAEELPQDGEKVLIEVDYGQTPPQHFVSTMAPCEAFANDRLPFCFRGPGPFRHFGHEIIRWARI